MKGKVLCLWISALHPTKIRADWWNKYTRTYLISLNTLLKYLTRYNPTFSTLNGRKLNSTVFFTCTVIWRNIFSTQKCANTSGNTQRFSFYRRWNVLSLQINKRKQTFLLVSLTQTVRRRIHSSMLAQREVSLEINSWLRCVFHAEECHQSLVSSCHVEQQQHRKTSPHPCK